MSIRNTLLKATRVIFATAALAASVTVAHAGPVTLPVGLQSIYQNPLDGTAGINIQIRYNPTQTIYNTSLLTIDEANANALAPYEVGGSTVSAFFVDHINFCGIALNGIVGCAGVPGTYLFLDAGFMATAPEAPTAMGHELGHNLGLDHVEGEGTNLMNPGTYYDGTPAPLTQEQISQIFLSDLIQYDGPNKSGQAFISITPFAVFASVAEVPEPGSLALVGLAMGALTFVRRRKIGVMSQTA